MSIFHVRLDRLCAAACRAARWSPDEGRKPAHRSQPCTRHWRPTSSGGEHFLVVLDEITYPLRYGWLPLVEVLTVWLAGTRYR